MVLTHDKITFKVLEKIKLKQKEMKEKCEKEKNYWDKLYYECEKVLPYNIGFIDILVKVDRATTIMEIKTETEIKGAVNFCGDVLRQLHKYKQALFKTGDYYNIQMRLIVPDKDCLNKEQVKFFYDNEVSTCIVDNPLIGI